MGSWAVVARRHPCTGRRKRRGLNFTSHPLGLFCLAVFVVTYVFVALEDRMHLPKSKPVMIAVVVIRFGIVGYCVSNGQGEPVHQLIGKNLLEYAELLLFLLVAITCVNALEERRLFEKV